MAIYVNGAVKGPAFGIDTNNGLLASKPASMDLETWEELVTAISAACTGYVQDEAFILAVGLTRQASPNAYVWPFNPNVTAPDAGSFETALSTPSLFRQWIFDLITLWSPAGATHQIVATQSETDWSSITSFNYT